MARLGFVQHRKFLRAQRTLNIPAPHLLGHMEFLWQHVYQAGDPYLGDATDVEMLAGWAGEPGALVAALLSCGGTGRAGLIDPSPHGDGSYQIHDLFDHAPDYVNKRAEREAKRQIKGQSISDVRRAAARARWDNRDANDDRLQPDASELEQTDACEKHLHANGCKQHAKVGTPQPGLALPSPEESAAHSCSEPANAAAKHEVDTSPVMLTFPTTGKPPTWEYRERLNSEFAETYPHLDVLAEARKALQWCRTNRSKCKTARGMPRFLNGWMEKAVNRGGRSAPPAESSCQTDREVRPYGNAPQRGPPGSTSEGEYVFRPPPPEVLALVRASDSHRNP